MKPTRSNMPTLRMGERHTEACFSLRGGSWVLRLLPGTVESPGTSGVSGVKLEHAQSRSRRRDSSPGGTNPGARDHPGCQRAAHPLAHPQHISELPVGFQARPSSSLSSRVPEPVLGAMTPVGRSKRHFLGEGLTVAGAWPSSPRVPAPMQQLSLCQPSSCMRASLLVSYHCCLARTQSSKSSDHTDEWGC